MQDDVVEIVDNTVPPVENENFDIEVLDDAPQKDDATLALEARIQELEAEKQANAQAPPVTADAGFEKLAAQLAAMQAPVDNTPAPPTVDVNSLVEEVNKDFYNNPSVGVMKLLDPIVKNMQEQQTSANAKRDLQISKLSVLADESTKGIYNQYAEEVEAIVKSKPASETVYREALQAVRMNHFDDILQEQLNAKMEEALAKAGAQTATATKAPPFTNATGVPSTPPADVPGKVRLYKEDIPKVKQWMHTQGLPWESADDRTWAVDYLREKGAIK